MNITKNIENHFAFLCHEGFKCSVVSNDLEECVIYKGYGCDIAITYDLREHIIDFGIINAFGKYYPMIEIICKNSCYFSDLEKKEFEERCNLIITHKNIDAILEWVSRFINAHLRYLIGMP